nr:hypothetical protein [Tanacetum cinerariifolium]GFB07298.1 hypothetical protein [Tanacetum cinerariifolium]
FKFKVKDFIQDCYRFKLLKRRIKITFENADSSLRVELIPSKINTMASAIIYLVKNQKFNFSKYILDNMVKNLEAGVKVFLFSRFVQVFVNHQLGDMPHHKKIFVTPSLTKKKKQKSRRIHRKETEVPYTKPQTEESVPTTSNYPLPSGEDRMQLTELMNLCTNLQNQVLDLEKYKTAQAKEIVALKKRSKKLKKKKKSRTLGLKDYGRLFQLQEWNPLRIKIV